ncbi:alpha/beta fold hydrolase [Microbacterium trichothecenolyticum]|uniref:Alpha/beta fold hydrolase n=1 Tax=Microbacterium ureisolvens TaxID=2781186 RepID=A0ABS7HU73_9MICO|nr:MULTISPECIES: alpha/beta fold hydrolase [Microbacterium]MBW9108603.1 alpha/beta fold hydrolase [Microbacterium ureisolvens]MBW9118962.1 alpha/beta fold hydrolase [Microbacterium trichothecenolyticum]
MSRSRGDAGGRRAAARGIGGLVPLTRLMVFGSRLPLTRTPGEAGLGFEEVVFEATDGVELRGWFVPAGPEPAPTVVWVHGWLWNRLGNVAGLVPFPDRDVDFLPATEALHDAGFHVLMFDLANHGESGARRPLTFGPWEARDFAGAVAYVRSRPDVIPDRVGAIGMSAGGNTVLYGAPGAQPMKALLIVQPTKLTVFNERFARDRLGRFGSLAARSMDLLYFLMRAPLPSRQDPAIPARRIADATVQYVQGVGDPWGTMEVVENVSAATPKSLGVVRYPSPPGRYEGYRYVMDDPAAVVAFFRAHL